MGFDVDLFLQPLSPTLLCPLCRRVLEDPIQSTKCEHVFCELCALGKRIVLHDGETVLLSPTKIDHHLEIQCPLDYLPLSADLLQPVQNDLLLQRLDSLRMRCPHPGCLQMDSLLHMRLHRSTCEFAHPINQSESVQRFVGQSRRNGQELIDLRYALQRLKQTFERDAQHELQIHDRLIRCESDLQHLNERLKQLRESMVKLVAPVDPPSSSNGRQLPPLSNCQQINLVHSAGVHHSMDYRMLMRNQSSHHQLRSEQPNAFDSFHFASTSVNSSPSPASSSDRSTGNDLNSLWTNLMETDPGFGIRRCGLPGDSSPGELQTCVAFIRNLNEFLNENILREYLRQNEICLLGCDPQVTIYDRSRDFRLLFLKRDFHRLFDARLWPAGSSINLVPSSSSSSFFSDHSTRQPKQEHPQQDVVVVHGNRIQDLPVLFIRSGLTYWRIDWLINWLLITMVS